MPCRRLTTLMVLRFRCALLAVAEPTLSLLAFAFKTFGRAIGNADAGCVPILCPEAERFPSTLLAKIRSDSSQSMGQGGVILGQSAREQIGDTQLLSIIGPVFQCRPRRPAEAAGGSGRNAPGTWPVRRRRDFRSML